MEVHGDSVLVVCLGPTLTFADDDERFFLPARWCEDVPTLNTGGGGLRTCSRDTHEAGASLTHLSEPPVESEETGTVRDGPMEEPERLKHLHHPALLICSLRISS